MSNNSNSKQFFPALTGFRAIAAWNNKLFLFVVLNPISIILFRYIEEPLNHRIRKSYGKR